MENEQLTELEHSLLDLLEGQNMDEALKALLKSTYALSTMLNVEQQIELANELRRLEKFIRPML